MKERPTSLGLRAMKEKNRGIFLHLPGPIPTPHPWSGILLHSDNFLSYFLHSDPDPVEFDETNTHSFVTDPFRSVNLETAKAIADGLQLLSAVYFFLAFSLSPSFSLSSVKPLCWIFFFFSFFPLCFVCILYEDLQTGNLNE